MSAHARPLAWRAEPSLIWTQFEDSPDWVVYHPGSGDVHHLSAAARSLFAIVSDEHPHSIDHLTGALAEVWTDTAPDDLRRAVVDALALMDRSGLIYPIP